MSPTQKVLERAVFIGVKEEACLRNEGRDLIRKGVALLERADNLVEEMRDVENSLAVLAKEAAEQDYTGFPD